jgi:heme exporter protein D
VRDFLDMGGYARFVWPAYLITVMVMAGLLVHVLRGLRRNEAELARLRQRRAEAATETESHAGDDT